MIFLFLFSCREKENNEPLLLKSNAKIAVKCEWSLAKNYSGKELWKNTLKKYSGKVDIYSVSYDGFQTCNATEGKRLVSLKCGLNHHNNTKTLDFVRREGETYFLIGESKLVENNYNRFIKLYFRLETRPFRKSGECNRVGVERGGGGGIIRKF